MPTEQDTKHDAPRTSSAQSTSAQAAPKTGAATADAPKPYVDALKDAKAAVGKAPDGDLKDEAQRGIDQAEALMADGHEDRALTALRQAQAVVRTA